MEVPVVIDQRIAGLVMARTRGDTSYLSGPGTQKHSTVKVVLGLIHRNFSDRSTTLFSLPLPKWNEEVGATAAKTRTLVSQASSSDVLGVEKG
jgi:hypothetical protein